jgi:hypothetical protein
VTAFHGPGRKNITLHAYSPTLTGGVVGPGNPSVVVGKVVRSPAGRKFGKRLAVRDVPDVQSDLGGLFSFNARIKKGNYVQARCKAKKFFWRATWVYDDGSRDVDNHRQKCKRRR